LPRVYDIALETIAHGDGRVDPDSLRRFVAAYQTVTPLRLGELWAIPIMLRLALIENLRRVAVRISVPQTGTRSGRRLGGTLAEIARQDPKNLILVIADMAHSKPPMSPPFVSELARRLQGQGPALSLPLTWIEQQLADVRTQHRASGARRQPAAGGRSGLDQQQHRQPALVWAHGLARVRRAMSVVDRPAQRPGRAYAGMDFASRDRYRHVVEPSPKPAGWLRGSEVAAKAIELARRERGQAGRRPPSQAHVGYYLIDRGLRELEQACGARAPFTARLRRWASRRPLLLYLGAITLLTLLLSTGLLARAWLNGVDLWVLLLTGLLALLATGQLASALVNWLATLLASPRPLPRMDFSAGIPPQYRTLVVVPTMLTSPQNIDTWSRRWKCAFWPIAMPSALRAC
jgi:cyclic beta-1,2-glucan synthetase